MIIMAGIDHSLAPLSVREKLSFTGETLGGAYAALMGKSGISGGVIVSTCNRTELYLSADFDVDAFNLLCELAGTDAQAYPHYSMTDGEAMRHLCRVAGGLKSRIWGEDQILAQVKSAIIEARENRAACNVLEVMFREAVTAAKRIKSEIRLGVRERSIVHKALAVIKSHADIGSALVIGNGEIGRLMTRALVENGYHAAMTLRTYRHGETYVPPGAHTVAYDERYTQIADCDVLISATLSPHHTVELEKVRGLEKYPKLIIDLAVPRDIDPEIAKLPGVVFRDVDSLSIDEAWQGRDEKQNQAEAIIDKHAADFYRWYDYGKRRGEEVRSEYFPLFIPTSGKKALVVGGGKIAARRAAALAQFAFDITVVAPDTLPEIVRMSDEGRLALVCREFTDEDLDGCFMVIAATDDREVNRRIGITAAERGIFASVADRRAECGFLFPALAFGGEIVAGLTSGGKSHHAAAEAARRVREVL